MVANDIKRRKEIKARMYDFIKKHNLTAATLVEESKMKKVNPDHTESWVSISRWNAESFMKNKSSYSPNDETCEIAESFMKRWEEDIKTLKTATPDEVLQLPVKILHLGNFYNKKLAEGEIVFIRQLVTKNQKELRSLCGLTYQTTKRLETELEKHGLKLNMVLEQEYATHYKKVVTEILGNGNEVRHLYKRLLETYREVVSEADANCKLRIYVDDNKYIESEIPNNRNYPARLNTAIEWGTYEGLIENKRLRDGEEIYHHLTELASDMRPFRNSKDFLLSQERVKDRSKTDVYKQGTKIAGKKKTKSNKTKTKKKVKTKAKGKAKETKVAIKNQTEPLSPILPPELPPPS